MENEWEWRIGALQGYGECAWQQSGENIRRITVVMANPNGQMSMMIPISLRFAEGVPSLLEYDAGLLVTASKPLAKNAVADLDRLWSGSKLVLVDGAGMGGVKR